MSQEPLALTLDIKALNLIICGLILFEQSDKCRDKSSTYAITKELIHLGNKHFGGDAMLQMQTHIMSMEGMV